MKWQHCGKLPDHDEHNHVARQMTVVPVCTCENNSCICEELIHAVPRHREKFRCPGKQVRSVEIPVTTEVSV